MTSINLKTLLGAASLAALISTALSLPAWASDDAAAGGPAPRRAAHRLSAAEEADQSIRKVEQIEEALDELHKSRSLLKKDESASPEQLQDLDRQIADLEQQENALLNE